MQNPLCAEGSVAGTVQQPTDGTGGLRCAGLTAPWGQITARTPGAVGHASEPRRGVVVAAPRPSTWSEAATFQTSAQEVTNLRSPCAGKGVTARAGVRRGQVSYVSTS